MLDNTQGEHFELSNRLEAFEHSVPKITVLIRLLAHAVPTYLLRP